MSEGTPRILPVSEGTVQCLPAKREEILKCRFCVHSVRFQTRQNDLPSPARAFCNRMRSTDEVDIKEVVKVICDDLRQEGYRSMLNVIS